MLTALGTILGTIAKPIISWFQHKQVMAEATRQTELTIELEKQKVISAQATANIEWDQIMARNSGNSWKDEYFVIVLSIPVILSFVPGMGHYIMDGFNTLELTPDWFKACFLTAVAASFGRSELTKWRR